MPSAISSLFDSVALGNWLRSTLREPETTAFELDRLVPRRDAYWLRVRLLDDNHEERTRQFRIAAADEVDGGWKIGRWACVSCEPEEDGELAISEVLDPAVRPEVAELVGADVSRSFLSAYTPERRAVVCYELVDGSAFYGKLYRARDFDRVRETAQLLDDAGLRDCVVEPAAAMPRYRMVLWRGVEGTPLGAAFPGSAYERGLAAAGTALRRLHDTPVETGHSVDLADEWHRATEHMDRLAALVGRRPVPLSRLCDRLQSSIDGIGNFESRTLHGDYHDNQILLTGAGARILDLDGVTLGDPAVDVGNLLAHIDFRIAYTERTDDADRYVSAFRGSYGEVGGDDPERRVLFSYAVSLFRNACLYVLVPRRMRRLADACARALDRLERDH